MIGAFPAVYILAGVCAVLLLTLAGRFGRGRRPVRYLFKAAAGMAAVFILNYAFSPFGLRLGVNLTTCGIVAVLGAPGLVSLYVAQYLL